MKIIINEISTPMFTEFTLCKSIDRNKLIEKKKIRVDARFETKTRISTTMYFDSAATKINLPVENFKTDKVSEYSYFSGETNVSHFFKKSKKQDKKVYLEYLKEVLTIAMKDYLKVDIDVLEVDLVDNVFNKLK